jgi:tetratricopeptide (TPR) repeat protein
VFRALSVFCGGFTRAAAQEVAGASLRELMALVNKSLLHRAPTGRYIVHELLRQYAAEKLKQAPTAERAASSRHCAFYASAAQQWATDLRGPRQQTALAEMRADSENVRAAWEWAVERGQVGCIEQALEGLSQYYAMNERQQEGERACRMAAQMFEKLTPAASPDERRIWAKVLARQGSHSLAVGRTDLASQLMQQSLALLQESQLAGQDTRAERAFVLAAMGSLASSSGELEKARQLYEQSLALYRALGDHWRTAEVLCFIGYRARNVSNYRKARQLAQESLALYRALGDRWKVAGVLYLLGSIARAQGRLEEAERLAQEETFIRRESGLESASGIAQATRLQQLGLAAWPQGQLEKAERLLREAIATRLETNPESVKGHEHVKAILYLGWTLLLLGRFAEAHALFREALAVSEETGRRHQQGFALSDLGFAKLHLGQYEEARAQARVSLPLGREIGVPALVGRSLHVLGAVALAEGAHQKAHQLLQESVSVYQEMGEQERLGQALAVLGCAARAVGELRQAERHLSAALRTAADMEVFRPLIYALPAAALLLVDRGEAERATDLYALASRYPFVANSRWFGDVAGRHIAAAALPPEGVAVARDLWAMAEELLAELGEP